MEPRKESLPGVDAEEPNVEIREPVREPSFLLSPGIVPPGAPNGEGKLKFPPNIQLFVHQISRKFSPRTYYSSHEVY